MKFQKFNDQVKETKDLYIEKKIIELQMTQPPRKSKRINHKICNKKVHIKVFGYKSNI